mgnify:CR=1 FL=1
MGHLLGAVVEGDETADSGPCDRLDPGGLLQAELLQVHLVGVPLGPTARRAELRRGLEIGQPFLRPAEADPNDPAVVVRVAGIPPLFDQPGPERLRRPQVSPLHLGPGAGGPRDALPLRPGQQAPPGLPRVRHSPGKVPLPSKPSPLPRLSGHRVNRFKETAAEEDAEQQRDRRSTDHEFAAAQVRGRERDPEDRGDGDPDPERDRGGETGEDDHGGEDLRPGETLEEAGNVRRQCGARPQEKQEVRAAVESAQSD